MKSPDKAIRRVGILRLSALGDVCHTVPLLRALQEQLPDAEISWIVDRRAAPLLRGIDGVKPIVFDKHGGLGAIMAVRRELVSQPFDALLVTQRSFRANSLSRLAKARLRVGYDRKRSREFHGLVINARIRPGNASQHVIDCLLSFLAPIGLQVPAEPRWDFKLQDADLEFAQRHIPHASRNIILSPASSIPQRNWRSEHYAVVADHAIRRHNARVLICGGPTQAERLLGDAILSAMRETPVDLIGRDTLSGFLALCQRATLVISPDSGPVHMADAMGAPVLGLYAATDCNRSGPYSSRDLCINEFPTAARRFHNCEATSLRWGKHIHVDGVMDLVRPEAVIEKLDRFFATQNPPAPGQG